MGWQIISKDASSNKFYPIDVLANTLPNSARMSYQTAKAKPISFWPDKKVIFHMTWAGKYLKVWNTFYRKIARVCPRFWIEFDADQHMNHLHTIDFSFRTYMCMYNRMHKYCNKFLWELPSRFNPFIGTPTRVPAGIYHKSRELPVRKKDIDFLGLIDLEAYNAANTLRLLMVLPGNVKCIVINPDIYKWYKNAEFSFELIKNSKTIPGQQLFYSLLDRSKVLVALSHRLTLGRNLYEALFHGALSVCSDTFGASELLFPDFTVPSHAIDLNHVREKCMQARERWSPAEINTHRRNAAKVAGIQKTIQRLQVGSK